MKDSIFYSSLKAFCIALFSMVGVVVGAMIAVLILIGICSFSEKSSYSSNIKIVADGEGNRKELPQTAPILLQINIKGVIGKDDLKGSKIEELLYKLQDASLKGRVKGILLVFNSPGGDVTDSDIIYRQLTNFKKVHNIPIHAYVDGLCASGGYYIAAAADKIYASDVSLIGSIGVISWPPFFNVVDLLQKVGVQSMTLSAGKGKDELNPLRPWKEGEDKNRQELISYFYHRFVNIVAENRPGIDRHKLIDDYGAKVFPAPLAMEEGLIDHSGYSHHEALKTLASSAGIKDGEKYQVISIESKEWLKKLFEEKAFLLTGKVKHEFELPSELLSGSCPVQYLYK